MFLENEDILLPKETMLSLAEEITGQIVSILPHLHFIRII